jgi:hypothetical protein
MRDEADAKDHSTARLKPATLAHEGSAVAEFGSPSLAPAGDESQEA